MAEGLLNERQKYSDDDGRLKSLPQGDKEDWKKRVSAWMTAHLRSSNDWELAWHIEDVDHLDQDLVILSPAGFSFLTVGV